MTTEQYLKRIERLDTLIQNRRIEIEQLWSLANGLTEHAGSEEMQETTKNRLNEIMERIVSLEKERDEYLRSYMISRANAIRAMEELENLKYYRVLFKHFIEFRSMREIARELAYSYDYVRKLYSSAIKEMDNTSLRMIAICEND